MDQRLKLILCTALSLPIAVSKQDKSEIVERTLKPLIKALFDFKQIKSTLSISGHLLDWCVKNRREYIQAIKELINDKRLELLSGGYYDPIFPLIPRTDGIDQIERTSTAISKIYRRRPHGVWINQLLWEPSLVTVLTKCAMEYTFLQDIDCTDYHDDKKQYLSTPVITEHTGKSIVAFPIATKLCHLWREHKFRALIRELRAIYELQTPNEMQIITISDDSEEHRSANFIQRFFQLLTNNSNWLKVIGPADISTNNYAMHTSHFYSQRLQKLKHTVGQSNEIGHIYAAMHHNHNLVSQLRADKQRKKLAKELILQGQNYYSFLDQLECRYSTHAQRKHAYGAFIETTQLFYKEKQKRPTIVNADYDFDGVTECLFNNDKIHSIVHRKGGVLIELSTVFGKWNWLDMSLADEVSNYTITSPEIRKRKQHIRNCSIDYLIPEKGVMYKFLRTKLHNYSLANHLFALNRIDHDQSAIHLQTTIELNNGSTEATLDLQKCIQFQDSSVTISYQLQNKLDTACKAIFATQLNISPSLLHFDSLEYEYADITTKSHPIPTSKTFLRLPEITTFHIHSTAQKHAFTCRCAGSDMVFFYRLREQKAIVLIPCWNLLLGPQDSRSLQTTMEFSRIQKK